MLRKKKFYKKVLIGFLLLSFAGMSLAIEFGSRTTNLTVGTTLESINTINSVTSITNPVNITAGTTLESIKSITNVVNVLGSIEVTKSITLNTLGSTEITKSITLNTLGSTEITKSIVLPITGTVETSGSSAGGGGNTLYRSPHDFTATYASGTTLTLAGLSFTPVNSDFISVTKVPTTEAQKSYSATTYQHSYSGSTLTVTGASFGAGDLFRVELYGPDKGYDQANNALRNSIINRDSDKDVSDTVAAVTNGTDGTYNYYVDCETYKDFAIQSIISQGSGSFWYNFYATAQNDGTAAASCTYVDVTSALTGTASFNASNYHFVSDKLCKYLKITGIASTAAANNADWTFYLIKK